jgi:electron transfer flavoprotein alpha subunit
MANNILVVAEGRDHSLRKVSFELVTIATEMAKGMGGTVQAVVMGSNVGPCAELMAKTGVSQVYHADDPALEKWSPEVYGAVLAAIVRQAQPAIVLLGATGYGKELGGYVGAKLDLGLATDCIAFQVDNGTLTVKRPIYAGKAMATVRPKSLPVLVSMRPNIFPPAGTDAAPAPIEKVAVTIPTPRSRVLEKVKKEAVAVDLAEAKIIVSGGRGVKSTEGFGPIRELASTLGAAVGASRAAVDAGWIDYSTQVGQTGKTVAPQLYFAAGISGAIQHLAGMSSSKHIVAINKDPDAPIFKVADYGIVGDLFEVVPVLTQELKKVLAEK